MRANAALTAVHDGHCKCEGFESHFAQDGPREGGHTQAGGAILFVVSDYMAEPVVRVQHGHKSRALGCFLNLFGCRASGHKLSPGEPGEFGMLRSNRCCEERKVSILDVECSIFEHPLQVQPQVS